MFHNRRKLLSGVALAFGIQGAFAGDAWLVITSDQPGTAVSVDGTYRGVTPQRPNDALRIQVSQGTHVINASARVDGKDYVAREVVRAQGNQKNRVQFNLRQESPLVVTPPIALPVWASKLWSGVINPLRDLEVPGRNF